jgi:hypothetical protein
MGSVSGLGALTVIGSSQVEPEQTIMSCTFRCVVVGGGGEGQRGAESGRNGLCPVLSGGLGGSRACPFGAFGGEEGEERAKGHAISSHASLLPFHVITISLPPPPPTRIFFLLLHLYSPALEFPCT